MNTIKGFQYIGELEFSCNNITEKVHRWIHEQTEMEFVQVPKGTFKMGSERVNFSTPIREVTVKSFLISQYTVTQKIWEKIMESNPSHHKGEDTPVHIVSWNDCKEFCQKTGLKLPSEAQWEYAARTCGKTGQYYWGEATHFQDYIWCMENIPAAGVQSVGQKKPNALGLYDILGNIFEWCEDSWQDNYENAPLDCSPRIFTSDDATIRGGRASSHYVHCCSFIRSHRRKNKGKVDVGFRVVADI